MPKGTKAIGAYIRRVGELSGHEGVYEFADALGIAGPHLGRVMDGQRLPGASLLTKLLPFIKKANENPRTLIYAWLEANQLGDYVKLLKEPQ